MMEAMGLQIIVLRSLVIVLARHQKVKKAHSRPTRKLLLIIDLDSIPN
jgi:hypothetical protein